jgi:hypothetical protein
MIHAFYECPTLPGMDKDAHRQYFRSKAFEKLNSKHHQYVNQIYADDECSDGEEYDKDTTAVQSMETTAWTNEDLLDYQSGAWEPEQNFC